MREAAVPGYRLARSKRSTRLLTSLALIAVLLGLLASVLVTISKTGLAPSTVRNFYLGSSSNQDDQDFVAALPRPFAELAEVTHLHLMGGSLLLFLLCHLLALCDIDDRLRVTLYLGSFVSFISTFTLPWLIVYLDPFFAYFFGPSVIILLVSLVVLAIIPLFEMWGGKATLDKSL